MTPLFPKHLLLPITAILVLSIVASHSFAQEVKPPDTASLTSMMAEYLDRLEALGYHGSVLAAKDGKILLHEAYGLANPVTEMPNRTTTLFSTGSVTKQYTATAIMLLAERGQLAVTDSIGKFFDNTPVEKQGITIHHLLTHSSGLPPEIGMDEEVITRDEYVERALGGELSWPPGTRYDYSNTGYSLLAAIIEIVSGQKYEEFLREHLWQPAGMVQTGLNDLHLMDSMVACSHSAEMNYMSPAFYRGDYWNRTGNGGILTTPGDMWLWLQALRGGKVMSLESLEKMWTPYILEYQDGDSYYGYGWVVQEIAPADTLIWHNGGGMPVGWSCAVYQYLKHGTVAIVFANKPINGNHPVDRIAINLSRIMRGEDVALPPRTVTLNEEQCRRFIGRYSLTEGNLEVVREGDKLYVRPSGQQIVQVLFPSPMSQFLPKYNELTITLINHLTAGDWQSAMDMFDRTYNRYDLRGIVMGWWQGLSQAGKLKDITIHGTVMEGAAKTYCRLWFSDGPVDCSFGWMQGECLGMTSKVVLERELIAESPDRLTIFDLNEERSVSLKPSEEGDLILSFDHTNRTAKRN